MSLEQLARRLCLAFLNTESIYDVKPCRLFLSASNMKTRALTRHAVNADPADAWTDALTSLKSALGSTKPTILRADWVVEEQQMTWSDFLKLIGRTRRNYFRQGVALDPEYKIAFTESELNANAMIYRDGKEGSKFCVLRPKRFDEYHQTRFNKEFAEPEPTSTVVVFRTEGAFISDDEKTPIPLTGTGLNAGHRDISPIDDASFLKFARTGAQYLAGEVQKNGRFIYGHYPCFDKIVPSYNTLRHFSSIFAMLDVYETYGRIGNSTLGAAINRALKYGIDTFIKHRTLEDGSDAAYPVDLEGDEIKLGALGMTLLALVKHSYLMKTKKHIPLMESIARGIYSMQNPDGSFVHVLNAADYSLKEPFRIVYYDGEAVFGMMRLYSLTKDDRLLAASELAFKRFIATDHWENHDHWLSYAANELTTYEPKREYFEFGINNFLGFLPFVYHRDTQFPTLLELMMAADTMLERIKKMPEMSDLLARVPMDDFYAAMENRAKNLLNGYFYPELAMFFKKPLSIVGSFFIRHHAFRVRTDDVEHFLSGFVAYRRYLAHRDHDPIPSKALLEGKAEGDGMLNRQAVNKERSQQATIFYGGDVNLGRRMNRMLHQKPFGDLKIMSDADFRIINLECVIANQGRQGINKGEGGPYYYHARPELINFLTDARIDLVLTANNHSKDYYEGALLEQNELLDRVGIMRVGTGANVDEAAKPIFIRVKDVIIAIFNVDATMRPFAATDDMPGTWYLPPNQPELWREAFTDRIADARKHSDLVFVAPHWGTNGATEPSEALKTLGRLLIDLGADAVLGCHSHLLHGVENYNGRPIIYDAGNFVFDANAIINGAFTLSVSKSGVEQVIFTPLLIGFCKTSTASAEQAEKIGRQFIESCRKLNTVAENIDGGSIRIVFPARPSDATEPKDLFEPPARPSSTVKIQPLREPLPEWTIDRVPDEAMIEPQQFGALKLVGCRIPPECMLIKRRQMLYVETYWTVDEPLEKNYEFRMLGVPTVGNVMPPFGAGMEHQGCDWLFPTDRWTPGVIYREKFGLRPPGMSQLVNVDVQLKISVLDGKNSIGTYIHPPLVRMQIPKIPTAVAKSDGASDFGIDIFKREFQKSNGVMFFMLRNLKSNASGLELSALRRATLFKKFFGLEVCLLTNEFQNNATDLLETYHADGQLLNMYDYFQEIDRRSTPARIAELPPIDADCRVEYVGSDMRVMREGRMLMYCSFDADNLKLRYINFFDGGKKIRRDTFDTLGFLSRRQTLEPTTGATTEAEYYRPDGSLAVKEIYDVVDKKSVLKSIELVGKNITFDSSRKAIKYWLDRLTADPARTYFMIGDRSPEYTRFYVDAKRLDRKNIFVIHQLHSLHVLDDFNPLTAPTKRWYNFLTDGSLKSDAIITLTEHQREDIIKRYGVSNVAVIPHAMRDHTPVEVERARFKIVTVGRLVEEKGVDKVLEAFKIVHDKVPQAELHFYGIGSMLEMLKQNAEAAQLGGSVVFEGFKSNIGEIFSSATVSVVASRCEGFSLAVQESLQFSCPVVSFDINYGPSDMIEDGVNGYLVPAGDVDALADRIIRLLIDENLHKKFSSNSARSVEKFSQAKVAEQWARLFYSLMHREDQ